jgi:hypothetical protein
MPKMNFRAIFAPHNRGVLLDLIVFILNLILFEILRRLATNLVGAAENDKSVRLAVALFLVGLFFLQPLIPLLKRWSFHQRFAFDTDGAQHGWANALLAFYKFFYGLMLIILSWLAAFLLMDVTGLFPGELAGGMTLLAAFILSLAFTKIVFSYFRAPKSAPRWKFLMTPQAEMLGDILLFLNVICFQILWGVYTHSQQFLAQFYSTTHLKSGNSFTAISERLWTFTIIALLIYFPPRIFYLVIYHHRVRTWLMMLLANAPLILGVVFFAPDTLKQPRVEVNLFSAPKQEKPEISNNPAFIIAAEDFCREYKLDEKATAKKYAGKIINITGRVREADPGDKFNPLVELDGGNYLQWVTCHFDAGQKGAVRMLEENQMVTLQCTGAPASWWYVSPTLYHCAIIRAQ